MDVANEPIGRVKPYHRNPRRIDDLAVEKVAASLREFGWRQPIVVDADYVVIVGHTRLLAARSLGMDYVPVHVAQTLTPAQVQAYRLADNRVAEESEWDKDLLQLELGELGRSGFDLKLTGFDADELPAGDDAPAAEAKALVEVTAVARFWISVHGPFDQQPAAIQALKALAAIEGIDVTSNVME